MTIHIVILSFIVSTLLNKYKKAQVEVKIAEDAFNTLNESTSDEQKSLWTKQAQDADKKRFRDLTKLDVYDSTLFETGILLINFNY